MKLLFIFTALCFVVCISATQVKQCPNSGKTIEDLEQRIKIGNCNKPPCRLRKDTVVITEFKFKPDRDISNLKNTVNANILGVPFPFVGVDGQDACNDIYLEDGKTKAGCNLKAGEEYVYKSKIDVLQIYPRLKTVVHWGLTAEDGKDVICFEVPARITN